MRGLDWQPLQIGFGSGVNQRADDRALPPPALTAAIDVQFDELGGLQTRKPHAAIGSTIAGGGTIANTRRLVANGDELLLWTKDSLYSWNDQLNRWVFRATHLAVAVEERTAFATPGDQYDGDRAELSGIVYTAWTDTDKVYVAAHDKASGAVINAPTAIAGVGTRPRLVALATKVLLLWHQGTDAAAGDILALSIDPTATNPATLAAQLAAGVGTQLLLAGFCGGYYDVTRVLTTDTAIFVARRGVTTSYELATITAAAAIGTAATKARTCDGPIAVSSDPTGATVQVIRANSTNIQGDRITVSGLVDAATGQAIGTVGALNVSQIAAAHRSTQDGGAYRCYAFWTAVEVTGSTNWTAKYNYVDTAGSIGTQATFGFRLGLASRAFDHGGNVFVWFAFAGQSSFGGAGPAAFRAQLQNTYFLYRDDATLHAKAAAARGGGLSPSVGRLPGVALTSGTTVYSWCGTERRIIPLGSSGNQTGYAKRAPRDITFTFDSNNARRCARLGETLYVAGGELLQYDGVSLYEAGFHIYPWYFVAGLSGLGNIADGTYTYKVTWRWENAKGEMDRSTTATTGEITVTAGPKIIQLEVTPLNATHKTTAKPVAVEVWRTAVNPPEGAPFYLTTSQDPSNVTNPNRYIPNAPTSHLATALEDSFADATLTTKESNDENGDVLEDLSPPASTIIAATDTRLFIAGIAGEPDRVWYSKQRRVGRVAAFHDTLAFDVPTAGGAITGIEFQNGICVVFRETATYMFPGDGFDNTGRGQNYGPPQVVSHDVGCRDTDSIVATPEGIAFQSSKGKYLLTRGWTMKPIGLAVSDYDSEVVVAAHVVPAQHQVRWVTASRVMIWDYLADAWAEWTISAGKHAAIWQGTYHALVDDGASLGIYAEQATFTGTAYGLDVETAWIKPGDLQGAVAFRRLQLLGEIRSTESWHLRFRVAYDYNPTWVDDTYWPVAPAVVGRPLQAPIRTSRQKGEAIKLRVTVVGESTPASATLFPPVPLFRVSDGAVEQWSATLRAVPPGNQGNGITMSLAISVVAGATAFVDVRDHQYFDAATGLWTALADNVGVRVITATDDTLISAVETAITTYSELLLVVFGHAGPARLTSVGFGDQTVSVATTTGGSFGAPTDEAIKLTGLGLEVGLTPRLHRRFPR